MQIRNIRLFQPSTPIRYNVFHVCSLGFIVKRLWQPCLLNAIILIVFYCVIFRLVMAGLKTLWDHFDELVALLLTQICSQKKHDIVKLV